jgi:hypothetical protein
MNNETQLNINAKEYQELYVNQQYDLLSEKFINILTHFEQNSYYLVTSNLQHFINVFLKNFFFFLTQPEYNISDKYVTSLIQLNPVISNITAISCYETTDHALEILKNQEKNFIKILILYSARNKIKFDYSALFNTNETLACLWYSYYCDLYLCALVNPLAYKNLRKHITYEDEKLTKFYNIADVYFGATYINIEKDKIIKQKLNTFLKNTFLSSQINIENNPNPKKIGVITRLWYDKHSVYRTLSEFLDSLKDDYEITLIHLGRNQNPVEAGGIFKKLIYLDYKDGVFNVDPIKNNNFNIIYYPDIGMSPESILLSNLRLAPIQICGTGHPVSTWGSQIDYFISGEAVENEKISRQNYSEKLILLKGYGAIHNIPDYKLKYVQKTKPDFIINCCWLSQKVNYPHLLVLKKIIRISEKKLLFRFFSGGGLRKNGFIPFVKDLDKILGKNNFEVIPSKSYSEYMEIMEEGDLSIESYPFGGSNVTSDSLFLRQPIVTYEGTKWYNRIGSAMVRSVGLEELISTNEQEYIKIILRLINDDNYRLNIKEKLIKADLNQTIYSKNSKYSFKQAIDSLVREYSNSHGEEIQN